jgi:large subunit ribosomal protein L33
MAKKAVAREYVFLECPDCKSRNYRTSKKTKGGAAKLELAKFCPKCRKHTTHNERRK